MTSVNDDRGGDRWAFVTDSLSAGDNLRQGANANRECWVIFVYCLHQPHLIYELHPHVGEEE